jgi:hypothetical protein
MKSNHVNAGQEFTAHKSESSFSSVWGNEMQREDFLALASGIRQFSACQADMAFVVSGNGYASEQGLLATE